MITTLFKKYLIPTILSLVMTSCGTYFNQPYNTEKARAGEVTPMSDILEKFPLPSEPVVVGVYNFKDQTGQYKSVENGSTFSTAVSQGGTTMLIKALEDSKWFTPIERENLGNLLNERNIIRSTRDEYRKNPKTNTPNLPPLLYAGILLEGGVVSYDSNIITGGLGARYFGVGGSTQYRQDRITVYLRAVSTSNGRILKTVYISKTILSQAVDASLFRYVNFQRLLEAETGYTKNEPVQIAMKEAIEKAVEGLIVEGIKDGLWKTKEGDDVDKGLVLQYEFNKAEEESLGLYNRKFVDKSYKSSFGVNIGSPILSGDYTNKDMGGSLRLDYAKNIFPHLSLVLSGTAFKLKSGNEFNRKFAGVELAGQYLILPFDTFSPYLYAGSGVIYDIDNNESDSNNNSPFYKFQYGGGLEYMISDKVGVRSYLEHHLMLNDNLDN
jgi:curli production assembly/transport component CsgG